MTDREQLLTLYRACFPEDDPSFWKWVFDRLYCPGNTLNVRENGRIIASLQMIPCNMRLKDRLFAAHYIYAASTLPEKQGKGLMAGLLARAAEECMFDGLLPQFVTQVGSEIGEKMANDVGFLLSGYLTSITFD